VRDIRGIIFDCDGVLFESRQANLAYYNTILGLLGEETVSGEDRGKAHLCHTAASPKVFEVLLGTEEKVEEALRIAAEIDYRRFIPCMEPEPGMVETLANLSGRMPLAVATNRGESMKAILDHFMLEGYFRTVVTCRDVERPKPYPDMLHLAAKRLGISEEYLLFVGDSELDLEAARRAGVRFAAYKGDIGGDIRLDSHSDLESVLSSY